MRLSSYSWPCCLSSNAAGSWILLMSKCKLEFFYGDVWNTSVTRTTLVVADNMSAKETTSYGAHGTWKHHIRCHARTAKRSKTHQACFYFPQNDLRNTRVRKCQNPILCKETLMRQVSYSKDQLVRCCSSWKFLIHSYSTNCQGHGESTCAWESTLMQCSTGHSADVRVTCTKWFLQHEQTSFHTFKQKKNTFLHENATFRNRALMIKWYFRQVPPPTYVYPFIFNGVLYTCRWKFLFFKE